MEWPSEGYNLLAGTIKSREKMLQVVQYSEIRTQFWYKEGNISSAAVSPKGGKFESTFLLPTSLLSSLQMLSKKFWNMSSEIHICSIFSYNLFCIYQHDILNGILIWSISFNDPNNIDLLVSTLMYYF